MKRSVTVCLAALLAAGLAFAGAEKETSGGSVKASSLQVVMIVKDLSNPQFVDMKNGGAAAAKKYGVQYTALAPEKYSVESQIRIMEDLIEKKVSAIVIVPIDGKGIVSAVERANQAGIPVFACNTVVEGGDLLGFAGIDHVAIGEALGKFAVDYLKGSGQIVILEGTAGASTARDRLQGMHNVLDRNPGITILESTTAKYNRQMAMQVMENMLVRFQKIDAVLCANDAMALGALQAVKDAGRKIPVAGGDAIPEALDAIESGDLAATVDGDGFGQGYTSVELVCKFLLTGEKPPAVTKLATLGATIITKANLESFRKAKAAKLATVQ